MSVEIQEQEDLRATYGLSTTDSLSDLLSCPFCAHKPDIDDPDTLYPNGIYWKDDKDYGRVYFDRNHAIMQQNLNPGQCWSFNCVTASGGCGAEVSGDSKDETIAKWQRRAT